MALTESQLHHRPKPPPLLACSSPHRPDGALCRRNLPIIMDPVQLGPLQQIVSFPWITWSRRPLYIELHLNLQR